MITKQPEGEIYREITGKNDFIFQKRGMDAYNIYPRHFSWMNT
jgi:hypothetical protein